MHRESCKQVEASHEEQEKVESSREEEIERYARNEAKTRGMLKIGRGFKRAFTCGFSLQARAVSATNAACRGRRSRDGESQRALPAPSAHGRRPHPGLLSRRFSYQPAALRSADQLTPP